jgi:hypothetical protein
MTNLYGSMRIQYGFDCLKTLYGNCYYILYSFGEPVSNTISKIPIISELFQSKWRRGKYPMPQPHTEAIHLVFCPSWLLHQQNLQIKQIFIDIFSNTLDHPLM